MLISTILLAALLLVTTDLTQLEGLAISSKKTGTEVPISQTNKDAPKPTLKDNQRSKRESDDKTANCDFGANSDPGLCQWDNINLTAFKWLPSTGMDSFWIGGPMKDRSETNQGGYAFFETSQLPNVVDASNTVSAMLISPILESTGSKGFCVNFSYAMDGLSADKLRIFLHPVDNETKSHKKKSNTEDTSASQEEPAVTTLASIAERRDQLELNFHDNVILATIQDSTRGDWRDAQIMYSFPLQHKLIIEAIPKDETDTARKYRGYIAIDDILFQSGEACHGHCTFDAGLCNFTNVEGDDDFDWLVGRGSENPNTGPIRDHASFSTNRVTGAFAYIDSGPPRRPNDKAYLLSGEFPATEPNSPLCLKFWTHMFGSGIGELNVYVRNSESNEDTKIWGLSGDAGNNWYMGQSPIASSSTFKIVFEGIVGRNSLGNIAIDDISIAPGVCPTSPQVASSSSGDCAFEDDSCGWINPEERDNLDELNWERMEASKSEFRLPDHTTGTKEGYFMGLSRNSVQRAGDRAFLMSPEMKGSAKPICVSFWYYMFEPIVDNTGPNLGKLAVWIRSMEKNDAVSMNPIWRMQNGQGPSWKYAQAKIQSESNFQIVMEGVWGNNRVSGFIGIDDVTFFESDCDTMPTQAALIRAECTLDRDSCAWRNTSTGDFEWRMATLARRPANLPDKTFGAPVGYAYFDIFNTGARSNRVRMISPTIPGGQSDRICFSFWFAAFGAGETTSLRIYRQEYTTGKVDADQAVNVDEDDASPTIWFMSAATLNTARPEWMPGQVSVKADTDFRIVLEGKASNGGFAIDHLVFYEGKCTTRPESAKTDAAEEEEEKPKASEATPTKEEKGSKK